MSIRDMLLRSDLSLTPSEEKIVQALLTDYPTAGLGTATALAKRAGVSDPTVVRLVMKLGFEGYPGFQAKLLAEVEARLHSPLLMMEAKRLESGNTADGIATSYLHSVVACMERTITGTPAMSYERAARLVSEAKGSVFLLGGRFSRHIAGMLSGYVTQMRSDVHDIGVLSAQSFDQLIDMDNRDVLVVFDYRRYQRDVVAFAEQAAARGVKILLFTDPWLSPISDYAEVTLSSAIDVTSPYDTLAPAVGQIEALAAHLIARMDDDTRTRIEELEAVRERNGVTFDNTRSNAGDTASNEPSVRSVPGPKNTRQEPKP